LRRVKLGEVVKIRDSERVPLNTKQRDKIRGNGFYPYIGANGIVDWVDEYIFDEKILCIAEDGGSWGKNEVCTQIFDEKCWVNNHAHVVTARENVITEYLSYYLNYQDLNSFITGTTRGKLNQANLKKIQLPLPTLSEQKAIVAKLDRAQRLIDIDRQMLAKYDELIQSVFLEMFGDPVRNEKGWEVKKLGEVCDKITDGTHHSPETFENEEYPYITAKHVDPFKVDFYSKPSYVRREDHVKIYSRCNPEQGDVLLIKDGATTGKAAINPYNFEFSMLSSLALLKLNEKQLRGNYLINVLNDERYKDLIRQKYMSGVAIKRYTLKKINQFEIPIPKIELQKQFDEIVANIDVEKEETLKSSKKSEELFSSLVQGAFG